MGNFELPALPAPYVPHVLKDRAQVRSAQHLHPQCIPLTRVVHAVQLDEIIRNLSTHPLLRCLSVHPGLEHVGATRTAPEGWYDRQPPFRCFGDWLVGVGAPFTAVFLDDYLGAPGSALHLTRHRRRLVDNTINGMSGYIADSLFPDILPQHYIARLLVVVVDQAVGEPSSWQPSCACLNVHQYINTTPTGEESRWEEMRTFALYRKSLDAGLARTGKHLQGTDGSLPFVRTATAEHGKNVELWQWSPKFVMCG